MGLYIFNKEVMVDLLRSTSHEDFGKEVFPEAIQSHKIQFICLMDIGKTSEPFEVL